VITAKAANDYQFKTSLMRRTAHRQK